MSNSSLVTYTRITKNRTHPRNHVIDTITIHCFVGQVTAQQGCDAFVSMSGASSNYVVGHDGSIGMSVEEQDRAWTSGGKDGNGNPIRVNGISGSDNDHRAVTIEVASDTKAPYAVTDAAYEALIKLLADICKRNGIPKLLWKGDKSLVGQVDKQNLTVHRWFAYKECPGEFLYERHEDLCNKVNAILGEGEETTPPTPSGVEYSVLVGVYTNLEEAESQLVKVRNAGFPDAYIDPPTHVTYTVKKGDTLYSIAQRFLGNGTQWRTIAEYNGMTSSVVHVGDLIKIPC